MIRRPPIPALTATLFTSTTLFLSSGDFSTQRPPERRSMRWMIGGRNARHMGRRARFGLEEARPAGDTAGHKVRADRGINLDPERRKYLPTLILCRAQSLALDRKSTRLNSSH